MSSHGMMQCLLHVWMLFLSLISDVNSCTPMAVGYPVGGYLEYLPVNGYPSNASECWYVYYDGDPRYGDRVTMTITTVSIEDSSRCSSDVLEIRDYNSHGTVLVRLCGDEACGHVTSNSSQLYFTFHSNHRIEKGGFFAKLRVSHPGERPYNNTTWQGKKCPAWYSGGRAISLVVFIAFAIVFTIGVMLCCSYICIRRCRRLRFRGGAEPMTRAGAPPPPQGDNPQPYATQIYTPSTPQSYPPGATLQYNPGAPQPQPSGAPEPYPSGA